jgi:hypothetical protein
MHAQVPTFSDEARAALVPEGEGLDGRREPPSLTQRRAIALQPAACICNKLQICIYIYIYMHIIYNHIRLIHTCMYACMHAYLPTYVRTYMHTYVRTYIHTYMRACMHTDIHTYIHACIHTYYPSQECWKLCMFDGYMGLQLGHYNPWLVDRQI